MPLTLFLLASGSPRRLLLRATCQTWLSMPPVPCQPPCRLAYANTITRCSSTQEPAEDQWRAVLPGPQWNRERRTRAFEFKRGTQWRKRQRTSRPAAIFLSLQSHARDLYHPTSDNGKTDLSYQRPRLVGFKGGQRRYDVSNERDSFRFRPVVSLYTILERYLEHQEAPGNAFELTPQELSLLCRKGFDATDVEKWAACLVQTSSADAVKLFEEGNSSPMFMILLFLRRKHVGALALGVLLRHIDQRFALERPTWETIKLLSVRLLRHARRTWPESMPRIAEMFTSHTQSLIESRTVAGELPQRLAADITQFSNNMLLLLSHPVNINPLLSASHQEQSQFRVLQFMASQVPAITVTQLGFRAVARIQLAHPKTLQEREWAQLKGPAWPPWKENRTAMDEEKGYEFGASRASRILHRLYEAGYQGAVWEELAELYAGWDTDLSPTIQTRTLLPQFNSPNGHHGRLQNLRWAGRVRTTRTRREAWACFLSFEMSGAPPSEEVYLAMFEKIQAKAVEQKEPTKFKMQLDSEEKIEPIEEIEESAKAVLPGDMKEVFADPTSPLHYVYLSEPIPTFQSLLDRMYSQDVRPSGRLLSFLVEAVPNFEEFIYLLETSRSIFDNGIGKLLDGPHEQHDLGTSIPGYFWSAFIGTLCRFSSFHGVIEEDSELLSPKEHSARFRKDREYLFIYSQTLLRHYKPLHRNAWSAYMAEVIRTTRYIKAYRGLHDTTTRRGLRQYDHIHNLLNEMGRLGLDIDDKIFEIVCAATVSASQIANSSGAYEKEGHFALHIGSPRLRKLFQSLVGANAVTAPRVDIMPVPPHIPSPATLHTYVRALGTLGDYEGLYSFSNWLTQHHAEVTARAEAEVTSGHKRLHRTIVALRIALTGHFQKSNDSTTGAPTELVQLVKAQLEEREEWGGWPNQKWVNTYKAEGERRKKATDRRQ